MRLRDLDGLIDDIPALTPQLLDLGRWISKYYCAPMESVMRALLPEAVRTDAHSAKTQKVVVLAKKPKKHEIDELARKAPRQASILRDLLENANDGGAVMLSEIGSSTAPKSPVGGLIEKGWVRIEDLKIERDPHDQDEFVATKPLTLTEEQAAAMEKLSLRRSTTRAASKPILLHGVTGSGKTEIYLQAAQHVLDLGMSARAGPGDLAHPADRRPLQEPLRRHPGRRSRCLHSTSRRASASTNGTASARAAPASSSAPAPRSSPRCPTLGLILVDEEHENSYKQENPPRYHGRDVAVSAPRSKLPRRPRQRHPALESFHNTTIGKYQLVCADRARRRPHDAADPHRRHATRERRTQQSSPSILSDRLRTERSTSASRTASRSSCSSTAAASPARSSARPAGTSATARTAPSRSPTTAPTSASSATSAATSRSSRAAARNATTRRSASQGFGTQKVEEILRKVFPSARIARIDADTRRAKTPLRDTLNAFKAHKIDMLLGTQMIAKGLHFPNVTLVGILNADLSLHIPDFRAGERTFQLLTQVAGRAGRGELEGEVVIQTFTPHSPVDPVRPPPRLRRLRRAGIRVPPPVRLPALRPLRPAHRPLDPRTPRRVHPPDPPPRLLEGLPEGIIIGEPLPSPLARPRPVPLPADAARPDHKTDHGPPEQGGGCNDDAGGRDPHDRCRSDLSRLAHLRRRGGEAALHEIPARALAQPRHGVPGRARSRAINAKGTAEEIA